MVHICSVHFGLLEVSVQIIYPVDKSCCGMKWYAGEEAEDMR